MGFYNALKCLPFRLAILTGEILSFCFKTTIRIIRWNLKTFSGVLLNALSNINKPNEYILVLGTRNSGKTCLIYRIKLSEFIQTVSYSRYLLMFLLSQGPTSSVIEETCDICRFCLIAADCCGHEHLADYNKLRITLCEIGYNDSIESLHRYMGVSVDYITDNCIIT